MKLTFSGEGASPLPREQAVFDLSGVGGFNPSLVEDDLHTAD